MSLPAPYCPSSGPLSQNIGTQADPAMDGFENGDFGEVRDHLPDARQEPQVGRWQANDAR